jgi:hypothetical protein
MTKPSGSGFRFDELAPGNRSVYCDENRTVSPSEALVEELYAKPAK